MGTLLLQPLTCSSMAVYTCMGMLWIQGKEIQISFNYTIKIIFQNQLESAIVIKFMSQEFLMSLFTSM